VLVPERVGNWLARPVHRLTGGDVACWLLTTSRAPAEIAPGWRPGTERELTRCVRPSYRLALMDAGQPCLLWLSGRQHPGVHALGVLAGPADVDVDGPVVPVRLTLLAEPVGRAELMADPEARDAEVLRMPAGSNPSWLSPAQFAAVLARVPAGKAAADLGPWNP
jgi:hypothetical protein